jgi:Flp pilus assembly protein TadG
MRKIWRSEAGQTLPLTILFLLVLLGIVAMVLDGGYAFAQRRRMQNAADSAVLAGVIATTKGEYRDAVVRQTVSDYARRNGAESYTLTYLDANGNALPNPTDGIVPLNAAALRVTTRLPFPTFFARLFGMASMTASAQATAHMLPAAMPKKWAGLSPLSVPTNFYDVCATSAAHCDLWDSSYAAAWGIPASEYKSLIDLSLGTTPGTMPQNVSQWPQYGYANEVSRDIWAPTVSGNYGNNVANALRQRITASPGGIDPDGVVWGTVDITIWDGFNKSDKSVHIAKFGRFKVRLSDVYGSHTYGHFIDFIVWGHERGTDDVPAGPKIVVLGG